VLKGYETAVNLCGIQYRQQPDRRRSPRQNKGFGTRHRVHSPIKRSDRRRQLALRPAKDVSDRDARLYAVRAQGHPIASDF
jgi:hypothetical protein